MIACPANRVPGHEAAHHFPYYEKEESADGEVPPGALLMSRFLSPKYLKYHASLKGTAREIDHDLTCGGCGYNLRGLKVGGRCPECGLAIDRAATSNRLNVLAPGDPAERARMRFGLLTAAVSLGSLVALRVWVIAPFPRPEIAVIDGIAFFISMAWVVAVWMITPAALDHYGRPMRIARRAVRVLNLAWPLAFAALLSDIPAMWIVCRVFGGIGVVTLLWILALAAVDADRDDVSKWLITSFWGLLFVSPVAAMIPRGIAPAGPGWVIYGFVSILVALWAILAAIPVVCIFSLGRTAGWKSNELMRRGTRSERIRERRAEIDRAVRSRIRKLGD